MNWPSDKVSCVSCGQQTEKLSRCLNCKGCPVHGHSCKEGCIPDVAEFKGKVDPYAKANSMKGRMS